MAHLDLEKLHRIEIQRAVTRLSSSKDWVKDHEKIQPYASILVMGQIRLRDWGFNKTQLKKIVDFLPKYAARFSNITHILISHMLFTISEMPKEPDFSKEDKVLCMAVANLCAQTLVQHRYRGTDPDSYIDIIKRAIALTTDPELVEQLQKKIDKKIGPNRMRCLKDCKDDPLAVSMTRPQYRRGENDNSYDG